MRGAGSGCPGEVEQRRQRLAKPLTAGNDVEGGRRPVFQPRRAPVPALAPVQLLEGAAAGATAREHVARGPPPGLKALEGPGPLPPPQPATPPPRAPAPPPAET